MPSMIVLAAAGVEIGGAELAAEVLQDRIATIGLTVLGRVTLNLGRP